MLKKLNRWFDNLDEPWRMLMTMVIACTPIEVIQFGHPLIGICLLFAVLIWGCSRI